MNDNRDLRSRLVAGQKRDGRREFNEDAVQELVALCLKPGVSIARMAMDHGVNPNQLRRWIARYQQQILHGPRHPEPMVIDGVAIDACASTVRSIENASSASAFVPVVSESLPRSMPFPAELSIALTLHVRLANGVEFDLGEANVEEIETIIQMLGRLACSGSTKV
ncbi:transposase [Paraburkholderia panacisoli]|uniref:Transposase n=1 Tax=Paraburkholderia panacisoli TaxID=2603818 RepID=A0A5B0GQ81_9BURK|nr:transposase [Paraburkholderia panacisoli]KAA1004309.1 transposase [Paraburkholderia panacisoli]